MAALFAMQLAPANDAQHPDKKLGSKQVTGHLVAFQEGDYAHASVRGEKGSELSFFVDYEVCFLAKHREGVLIIEYDEIERFFTEGDGYFPANVIRSIAVKGGEKRWLRKSAVKPTQAEQGECSRVLRATLSNDGGK
jgi:hypothetical protein